jgi:hypothetical protein
LHIAFAPSKSPSFAFAAPVAHIPAHAPIPGGALLIALNARASRAVSPDIAAPAAAPFIHFCMGQSGLPLSPHAHSLAGAAGVPAAPEADPDGAAFALVAPLGTPDGAAAAWLAGAGGGGAENGTDDDGRVS